ncbi:hypothetical protein HY256_03435 [Candidatus Sumerlaeota bacterium]|nr:hypothetical protein [Candidatus Sumerlaeota bacterium]
MQSVQSGISEWVGIVAIIGTSGVVAAMIITTVGILRLISGRRGSRAMSEDESRTLQELWNGLQKMEERITNLETILLHRERK